MWKILTKRLFSLVDVINDEIGTGSHCDEIVLARVQCLNVDWHLDFVVRTVAGLLVSDLKDVQRLPNGHTNVCDSIVVCHCKGCGILRFANFDPLNAFIVESTNWNQLEREEK